MKTADLIAYVIKAYSKKEDLSKTRLNKIVYLIDWKTAILTGKQMTDLEWKLDHSGLYAEAFDEFINQDKRFRLDETLNYYGNKKFLVSIVQNENFNDLSDQEKNIVDSVIEITQPMPWSIFIHSVYSTYPIRIAKKYGSINLIHRAKQYEKKEKR